MKRPRHGEQEQQYWHSCSPPVSITEHNTSSTGSSSTNDKDNTLPMILEPMTEEPHSADGSSSSSSPLLLLLLSCFGSEFIHEIGTNGNPPLLTRGGFGEISIALRHTNNNGSTVVPSKSSSTESLVSSSSSSSSLVPQWQLVAIKTMEQAVMMVGGPKTTMATTTTALPKLSKPIFHELCALRQLQPHPNIIPLLAVYSPPDAATQSSSSSLSLAFPYCPVDLHLALEWRRRTFQPLHHFDFTTVLPTLARDIVRAIRHCHGRHVLHRDVKPGNILVTHTGVLQLCDFGLAKPFVLEEKEEDRTANATMISSVVLHSSSSGNDNNDPALCTLNYRSPEALLGAPATHPAVDMYSVGTVIGELAMGGQPLFPGRNVLDQLSRVIEVLGTSTETHWPNAKAMPDYGKLHFGTRLPQSWTIPTTTTTTTTTPTSTMPSTSSSCSFPRLLECPPLANFVASLIALDPNRRLSSQQVLDHEWLQQLETMDTTTNGASTAASTASTAAIRRQRHCRRQIQQALIPDELRSPLSLSLLGCSKEEAAQQALAIASYRRRLFVSPVSSTTNTVSSSTCWKGPKLGQGPVTLDVLCQRFVAVQTP